MTASKKEWVIVNGTDDVLTLPKTRKGCYRALAEIDTANRTWQEIRDYIEGGLPSDHYPIFEDGEWVVYSITHLDDVELIGPDDFDG